MNCKNCNKSLAIDAKYCSNCGGKIIRNRLSFKHLFAHLNQTFFNYDNKLLLTILTLFKQPEMVINGYINGVRKRYINPVSFFGLSLTLSGISVFFIKKFYLKYFDVVAWITSFELFSHPAFKTSLEAYSSTKNTMEYSSLVFSAIIPVFAILSVLVFFDKKYNLTEHAIIYLYSMSLYSIVSIIIGQLLLLIMPNSYLTFIFLTYPIILFYHCYLLKRVFLLNTIELVARTLIFLFLFFLSYLFIGVLTYIIGSLQT